MTCNCNVCDIDKVKDEDDDWEIQRLEDIITICQALIKHKKRQRKKLSIDELLEKIEKETKNTKIEKNDTNTTFTHTIEPRTRIYKQYPFNPWFGFWY